MTLFAAAGPTEYALFLLLTLCIAIGYLICTGGEDTGD